MNGWKEMESAPRDGTQILVARNNDCGWDYFVVWWSDTDPLYPWHEEYNSFVEDRFDYWCEIEAPYVIDDVDLWEESL